MRHLIILLIAAALVCAAGTAVADPPKTMSYQGVLNDDTGNPVPDGTYDLFFILWDAPAGGTALWSESHSVAVEGGIFDVILGSVTPIYPPFDEPYWLGISVEGEPELAPRVELTAAPYAFRSIHPDDDWERSTTNSNIYRLDGSVGIGTSTPTAELQVHSDSSLSQLKITNNWSGPVLGLHLDVSSNYAGIRTYQDSMYMVLSTGVGGSSTPRIWINPTGEVGIGVAYPNEKLDVNGTTETIGFKMPTGATAGYVLTSDATGVGTWQPAGAGGGITGSGSTNYIPKFTGSTSIGNSIMYESGGTLFVPSSKAARRSSENKDERSPQRLTSKLDIRGDNGWTIYSEVHETDTATTGRAAVWAMRDRSVAADGAGYDVYDTNNAITGYNYWGDEYTFGVAGYTYGDYTLTGGVLGYHRGMGVWGALGYEDAGGATYGVYTPNSAYLGGEIYANSSAIEGTEIQDGTITNADISATAGIADSKISGTAWTHSDDGYPPKAEYWYGSGFTTTSSSYVTVTSRSITLPSGGYVFAEASAAAGYWNGAYEGMIALGFGSTSEEYYSERWFTFDTSDEMMPVSTSRIYYLAAGTHTIHFLARRSSGSGSCWLPRYTLSVIWIDQLGKDGRVAEPPVELEPQYRPVDGFRE
jgi:hypothetical protein